MRDLQVVSKMLILSSKAAHSPLLSFRAVRSRKTPRGRGIGAAVVMAVAAIGMAVAFLLG